MTNRIFLDYRHRLQCRFTTQWNFLQAEDGKSKACKACSSDADRVRVGSTSGGCSVSGATLGLLRVVPITAGLLWATLLGAGGSASGGTSGSGVGGRGRCSKGLAAGEEAGEAGLLAVGVLLGVLWASVSLVALHRALGRLQDLGSVGTGDTKALSPACYVGNVALVGTLLLRSGRVARNRRRTGDGGGLVLGKGESAEGERGDNDGVLHCDVWLF